MAKSPNRSQFQFRKPDRIGAEAAEADTDYLADCFIDAGYLHVLQDCDRPERIVVGRTGAGKTALLLKLQNAEERLAFLEPEALSLQYLSNSTIIQYLTNAGVNLDIFYRLLWRHIFAVELIRLRYNIDSDEAQRSYLQRIRDIFTTTSKRRERAMKYFVEWGQRFWVDTEVRISEITKELEHRLEVEAGIKIPCAKAVATGTSVATSTQRDEILHRAQSVVDTIQLAELSEVIQILHEDLLNDPQARCYIVIDRLDENWVDDKIRYRLIRALVETIKDFSRIKSAKIIIALRRDLIDRVVRLTRDAGFQEEKYESLYLRLEWSKKDLLNILDKRVDKLVRSRYTSSRVSYVNILPESIDGQTRDDFLVDRTLYRPRDIIVFFNACIQQAVDHPKITATMLKKAEAEYSERRFQSLGDEWLSDYPYLLTLARILRGMPPSFLVRDMTDAMIEEACLEVAISDPGPLDQLHASCAAVADGTASANTLRTSIAAVFYHVGLVGLKLETHTSFYWSFRRDTRVQSAEISDSTSVRINPTFFRILGTRQR